MSANNSRNYKSCQVGDAKSLADDANSSSRYALGKQGKRTFIAAESIELATGKRHKLQRGPKPWSKGKYISVCNLRLAGMERLIGGRHAGPVDTDDAETYYAAALVHLVARNWAYERDEERIMSETWARTFTPDLVAQKGRAWFVEQEQRILATFDNHDGRPSLPSADDFARDLGITYEEVRRHDLRTIGAVDRLKAQRIAEGRETHRARQKAMRAEKGATAREDSMATRKPWEALGMSRATYYRKVDARELSPDRAMRAREPKAPVLRLIRMA